MCEEDGLRESLFKVAKLEDFVSAGYPLRLGRQLGNEVWEYPIFSKNRDRLLEQAVVAGATRRPTGRARRAATTRKRAG